MGDHMELLQLKYFIDAAKTQNFSITAKRNFVPQSSISQTIKKLEKELGVTLFNRKGNRVILNENGKILQKAVEVSFSTLEDAKRIIKENVNKDTGELRLMIKTNRRIVIECIAHFRAKYPNVTFTLDHNQFSADYDKFDIIISEELPQLKMYDKSLLVSEKILLAVSKDHPLSRNNFTNIAALASERFISMSAGSSLHNILVEIFHCNGYEPNIAIQIDDPYYLRKYVELGLGIAIIPEISWKNMFNDTVKLLEINDFVIKRNTYIYRNSKRHISVYAKAFYTALLEHGRIQHKNG